MSPLLARHPYDRDALAALVTYAHDAGNASEALLYARRLANLEPSNAELARVVQLSRSRCARVIRDHGCARALTASGFLAALTGNDSATRMRQLESRRESSQEFDRRAVCPRAVRCVQPTIGSCPVPRWVRTLARCVVQRATDGATPLDAMGDAQLYTGWPDSGTKIGSQSYMEWFKYEFWRFVFVQEEVTKLTNTAVEYPPMQKGASFNLDSVKAKIEAARAAIAK